MLHRTRIPNPIEHIELRNDNLQDLNMKTNGTSNNIIQAPKVETQGLSSLESDSKVKKIKNSPISPLSK